MDFFKKMFEKKECSICQGEIGLLGNRKLEDGNMCKECAKKLSPWFEERRHATVEQINEQLVYRMENFKALSDFCPGKSYGEDDVMYVEDRMGTPYRFVVAKTKDYRSENTDIISFSDVSSCMLDLDENHTELKYTNQEKERVSYNPPRYEYRYNFYVVLGIMNNPYFDEIRFKLNKHTVRVETERIPVRVGAGMMAAMMNNMLLDPAYDREWRKYKRMYDDIEYLVNRGKSSAGVGNVNASAQLMYCPNCGEKNDGGKYCKNCGFYLK